MQKQNHNEKQLPACLGANYPKEQEITHTDKDMEKGNHIWLLVSNMKIDAPNNN